MRSRMTLLIVLAPLALLPLPPALAQPPPGMNEADMQRMMQQMQKAQACMEQIDQAEMQRMQQRAQQLDTEIEALCAQGKRDEAERTALAFAKEMDASPSVSKMKQCGELMPDMSAMMPMPMPYPQPADQSTGTHICD